MLTRSMAARRSSLAHALPHDMAVEIAGHVAATSPTPVTDLGSLRASCRAMRAACGDRDVGRRVALEREAGAMRWSDHERYLAVVGSLSGAGNPEACFLAGVALAFTQPQRARPGVQLLGQASKAGHRVAAYVRALLLYGGGGGAADEDDARRLIRQVEGEEPAVGGVVGGCTAAAAEKRRSNAECVPCRAQAVEAVRQAMWRMAELPASAVVALPEDDTDRCTAKGCGKTEAWYEWAAFCSEDY
ncbi:unnamed protein product [Urochloa decumbens]|uniref:At2g35280-like TPR domain-containing protein n=1 Tax=Urochloa decumbens TaxID=240449 RepID=A0ABC9AHY2_9POAL